MRAASVAANVDTATDGAREAEAIRRHRSARYRPATATVDDAIEALTDPACKVGIAPRSAASGFAYVNGDRILDRLRERNATDEEALALIDAALARLGGRDESYWQRPNALGGGPPQRVRLYAVLIEQLRPD